MLGKGRRRAATRRRRNVQADMVRSDLAGYEREEREEEARVRSEYRTISVGTEAESHHHFRLAPQR